MSRILAGCLLLAAVLGQATLMARLAPAPVPDLVVALVVARAWTAGSRAALAWAVTGGLLLDLAASGPFGTHLLATVVAAFVASTLAARLESRSLLPLTPVAFAAACAQAGVLVAAAGLLGALRFDPLGALATAVLGAAATAPVALIPAWIATRGRGEARPAW